MKGDPKAQLGRTKRPRSLSLKESLLNKKEERGLERNEVFLGGKNRVVRWRVTRTDTLAEVFKADLDMSKLQDGFSKSFRNCEESKARIRIMV